MSGIVQLHQVQVDNAVIRSAYFPRVRDRMLLLEFTDRGVCNIELRQKIGPRVDWLLGYEGWGAFGKGGGG